MRILSASQLSRRAKKAGTKRCTIQIETVDFSRPFIHEHFTPLYHTGFYAQLTPAQKLRYNQLSGIANNEQFQMFEHGFTRRAMGKLLKHPRIRCQATLRDCLQHMLAEEGEHERMFAQLNRRCLQNIDTGTDSYFSRLGRVEQLLIGIITRFPGYLIFILWLILVLEEHSTALSISLLKNPQTESLGPLDETIVRAHAAHLRDEARHVHIDALLIDTLLTDSPAFAQGINAWLFRHLLNEIIRPKRASVRVLRHLACEFPALTTQLPAMIAELRHGDANPAMLDPAQMPVTRDLLRRYPQFDYQQTLKPEKTNTAKKPRPKNTARRQDTRVIPRQG